MNRGVRWLYRCPGDLMAKNKRCHRGYPAVESVDLRALLAGFGSPCPHLPEYAQLWGSQRRGQSL